MALSRLVDADEQALREAVIKWDPQVMAAMSYQLERGENEGRLHLQGYTRFKERVRYNQAKEYICPGDQALHVEIPNTGQSEKACVEYTQKANTRVRGPWVYGEFNMAMTPGKRTDLDGAVSILIQHKDMQQVIEAAPTVYVKYHQGLKALLDAVAPKPPQIRDIQVCCIWGPPGTGKTTLAMNLALQDGGCEIYSVTPGDHCWDEYQQEKWILLDEFDWTKWDLHLLKRILDKFKMNLMCRYHNKYAAWTRVIICSNSSPDTWYSGPIAAARYCTDDVRALYRRIGYNCYYKPDFRELRMCQREPIFDPKDGTRVYDYPGTPPVPVPPSPAQPTLSQEYSQH